MPSSVDEQPPSRPGRPRSQPARRRPPARARATAPRPPARPRVDEPDPGPRRGPRGGSPRKTVALLSALSVLVVGLAIFGVALSSRSSKKASPSGPTTTAALPVTSFKDTLTGFTVEYPRSWQKIQLPVADYRLAVDGGSNVAFTIRVVPIETPATAGNLENFKAVTDGLVTSNTTVRILKQEAVSLNGMIGYYYFYTFADGPVQAVHAHYFLFSGKKMNILVFQSLPDDFAANAPIFDKIAESFRSDPTTTAPGPAVAPTTVP